MKQKIFFFPEKKIFAQKFGLGEEDLLEEEEEEEDEHEDEDEDENENA